LWSQIATSKTGFFGSEFEHEILRKAGSVAPDLLVEALGRHAVQRRKISMSKTL
jgi:hypothetical protein